MPPPDAVTPARLLKVAREYLRTPWVHQGREKGVAVDCAGFPKLVGDELGIRTYEAHDYPRLPNGTMLSILREHLVEIPSDTIRPADLVVLEYAGEPWHIAIVGDYPGRPDLLTLIHASNVRREVVEHRLDAVMARRIVAAFRVPEFC